MPLKTIWAWLQRYWPWILIAALFLFVLPMLFPGAIYYWGYTSFKFLFYDDIGLGKAWSSVLAVIFAITYALAFPFSLRWLMFGRRRIRALVSTVIIFCTAPLLHAVFDANFNRATGAAQKCYVWRPGGEITLSDGCGFDPALGVERRPLTPEVARIIERQKQGLRPNHITVDPRQLTFFDPTSGRSRVWYYADTDGKFYLYDSEGFNPGNGALLLPVTAEVIAKIKEKAGVDEVRTQIEAKAASERSQAEAREQARRQLRDMFGTDNYVAGVIIVGARARRPNDDISIQAAREIATALIANLRDNSLPATEIGNKVYASPYYDQLMGGDRALLERAGLSEKIRSALLSLIDVSCHAAVSVNGVLSCTVSSDFRIFKRASPDGRSEHWTEIGAGTTREDAVSQAVKALIGRHSAVLDGA